MAKDPFAGFTPLSPNRNIYLYSPSEPIKTGSTTTAHTRDSPTPDLVILSAWMGALPKHILKYTAAYQSSYPSSTIIVITNDIIDMAYRPHWLQRWRIQPAADFVHDFTQSRKDATVLVHSFSNGGGLQAVQLSRAYRQKYGSQEEGGLPVSALVLDSAPGTGRDFQSSMTAIQLSIPPALRPIVKPITFFMVMWFLLTSRVFGMKTRIDYIREGLLDDAVIGKDVPRAYVYSKEDELVGYQEVEKHAVESEAAGYWTEKVEFEGSGHVQHMMKDPKRYWGAVTDVMKEAEARS